MKSREERLKYQRAWHHANKQKRNEESRNWYHSNRDQSLATNKTWKKNHPERVLWLWAKERAKKYSIPFTIEPSDIVIPKTCPLLEVPISSPSIDQIIPGLGYIPGNVWVVSKRANTIKSDATLEELRTIADNLEKKLTSHLPKP